MKRFQRFLCAILLVGVLSSCAQGQTEQTAVLTAVQPADNTERDALFADREKTPRTVTETVGDVQYTVTFDREEYVLGDDVFFSVTVAYLGAEPLIFERTGLHSQNELIGGVARLGEETTVSLMYSSILHIDTTQTYTLTQGTELTRTGCFSGAEYAEQLANGTPLTLRFYLDTDLYCDIPMTFAADLPTDAELLPYLQSGKITEALYCRARVLSDGETVVVFSTDEKPPALADYLPEEENMPTWFSKHSAVCAVLTRRQLLTLLEQNYPVALDYNRQYYRDVLNYYKIGE